MPLCVLCVAKVRTISEYFRLILKTVNSPRETNGAVFKQRVIGQKWLSKREQIEKETQKRVQTTRELLYGSTAPTAASHTE